MSSEAQCQRLKGQVAIVTGGAHGIGKAYCVRLAAEGAKVVIADQDGPTAEVVARSIRDQGGEAFAVRTDVSDPQSTEAMARRTVEKYGRIDVLVNNAAVFAVVPLTRVPFWQISIEEWNRVMAVNVTGPFLCVRAVVPYMMAQGKGKIINGSASAFHAGMGKYTHYVTSRGATIAMTRSMARDLGQYNINVNAIAPGATITPESSDEAAQLRQKEAITRRAIKRTGTPEDLTGAIVFMASSDSDFMTGETMIVDGGANMR